MVNRYNMHGVDINDLRDMVGTIVCQEGKPAIFTKECTACHEVFPTLNPRQVLCNWCYRKQGGVPVFIGQKGVTLQTIREIREI